MTKRTPLKADGGINPKLAALAAKLDAEYARVRKMHAEDDGSLAAGDARNDIYIKISRLGDRLAEVAATNLEELKLKARYIVVDWEEDIQDPVCLSIVRALLDDGPTVSEEVAASYMKATS